ncbi:hypothetical protein P152DRAFT_483856 [Eremomyces bilateralis CBS 781.70]|uniref:Exoribonuclease phosphorolytic domain-containing protein n=1 Tax=Eremomyces bilateralis CBS 781.70 TaxID=1392243 RepID=A0A6G1FXR3_9PEZI|nr:uncharacterized protein P152DRAFT_483856 [Eremomyces bilateralis CBS 781.70]KAF1810389.1 hypothetical protein P152DRAFT_483856 [Eremomyces bilateralis CBS 781.70]
MSDRRRINPPPGGTSAPVYASSTASPLPPTRTRRPDELRKIFLKTHITPSATGSAYLELPPSPSPTPSLSHSQSPSLKLTATAHLAPLPRSAPFTPNLLVSVHVKFAPFASPIRRGYIRDAGERELSVRVENALRGVIIAERWPKMGLDLSIVVLEGEEEGPAAIQVGEKDAGGAARKTEAWWATMTMLAGCVNVAAAAVVDAGIDCVDAVAGGVAAMVPANTAGGKGGVEVVLDPVPREHGDIIAAAVVAYLPTRDEITELWVRGDPRAAGGEKGLEDLVDAAASAAVGARTVILEAAREEVQGRVEATEGV